MNEPATGSVPQAVVGVWPSAAKFWLYWKVNLFLYLLFVVVYGATNYLATMRMDTFHFYMDWEQSIPFVPQMIYVYLSICLLFWLPLFFVETNRIKRLGFIFAGCILAAGCIFLFAPAKPAFSAIPQLQSLDPLDAWVFSWLYRLDERYNTFPSLHVALSTLTVMAVREGTASRLFGHGLLLWLLAIMVSVILVHQHYLADVAAGWMLGHVCYLIYARRPLSA